MSGGVEKTAMLVCRKLKYEQDFLLMRLHCISLQFFKKYFAVFYDIHGCNAVFRN